jgi:hypothetical protein
VRFLDLATNLARRKRRCMRVGVDGSRAKLTNDFIELSGIDSLNGLPEHLKLAVFEERKKASRVEVRTS